VWDSVRSLRGWLAQRRGLLVLAVFYSALNVPKPLTVDDAAYYYFAEHISREPLRPYDFQIMWYSQPEPAIGVLAPPVLPCWWALGLALFGGRPWLWKVWLLPFAVVLVAALDALARRFARPASRPLVWLVVLSPLFLPSFNLMLDVPAQALGLAALAVFCRACGRRSLVQAVLAGVLAGLAMQVKYTAFLVPALFALYAVLFSRLRLGVAAVTAACGFFALVEGFIVLQHGQSHFLVNLPQDRGWSALLDEKTSVALALVPMLGGLAGALVLLGLAGLNSPRWLLVAVGGFLLLGYAAVASFEIVPTARLFSLGIYRPLEQLVFGISGMLLLAILAVAGWELWTGREVEELEPRSTAGINPAARQLGRFLVLWLLLELVGYFPLSPFPAARRVMGMFVVITLLLGRQVSQNWTPAERGPVLAGVLSLGIVLGLGYYTVDFVDAWVQKQAPEEAVRIIAEQPAEDSTSKHTVWYAGHWGIQFYAERAGMKPVVPYRSILLPGDWLVIPDSRWEQQLITIEPEYLDPIAIRLAIPELIPVRTVRCFYGGWAPLEHHSGPRITVVIYRVAAPWRPPWGG
jgi:MFS family permease